MNQKRNFIIQGRHSRGKRLWQFFFTGWGLVMVAALVAGALMTQKLLWTPITPTNMSDIINNQFRMTNGEFHGTDENGEPFNLHAASARQEYENPDIIYLETVSGDIARMADGKKIRDNIRANGGHYNRANRTITLLGNVRIDSSNGDKVLTEELVIRL
jgi:hypothetical protein